MKDVDNIYMLFKKFKIERIGILTVIYERAVVVVNKSDIDICDLCKIGYDKCKTLGVFNKSSNSNIIFHLTFNYICKANLIIIEQNISNNIIIYIPLEIE